jgi:thiamine-monophosphate kinase
MMDLSDGLARDLPRILKASGCAAEVELQQLPLHTGLPAGRAAFESAVGEGEDYELLVVMAPRTAKRAQRAAARGGVGLTAIGSISIGKGLRWKLDGKTARLRSRGWAYDWGR